MQKNRIKNSNFFLSKFAYYISNSLLAFFVFTLTLALLCYFIYSSTKDNIIGIYSSSLESGTQQLSGQLVGISTMMMTSNETITGRFIFSTSPLKPSEWYYVKRFYSHMCNIIDSNGLFEDIVIYFPRADVVVSRNGCYSSLNQYVLMNNYSNETVIESISNPHNNSGFVLLPGCSIHSPGNRVNDPAFLIGVPFAMNCDFPTKNIYAYLMINSEQLVSMFSFLCEDDTRLEIADSYGNVLFAYGETKEGITPNKITSKESNTGLILTTKFCISGLLHDNLRSLFITVIVAFLLYLIVTIYCAKRAAKPMDEVANQLSGLVVSSNPEVFSFVHESIEVLDQRCSELQNTLSSLQNQRCNTLIARTLFTDEVQEIPNLPNSYAICYSKIWDNRFENIDLLLILISEYLANSLLSNVVPHMLTNDSFLLILPVESRDDMLIDKLSQSIATLRDVLKSEIDISISSVYTHSSQLKKAYEEAKDLLTTARSDEKKSEPEVDQEDDKLCAEFVAFVNAHYSEEEFCIQNIEESFGLTERGVYDISHKATGISPAAYIQQVRLENACSLLRNTDLKVDDIRAMSGYGNVNTFYKAFKRTYNVTPTQYRQNFMK